MDANAGHNGEIAPQLFPQQGMALEESRPHDPEHHLPPSKVQQSH